MARHRSINRPDVATSGRRAGVLIAALMLASVLAGTAVPDRAAAAGDRYPGALWRARQDDYLSFVTGAGLSQGSPMSIMAFAERALRDPSFVWDPTLPDPSDFAGVFQKLAAFEDTSDFNINDFLFLWYGWRDVLRPDLRDALKQRLLSFKYWWTEPTPPGITDSQYYWTENHLIIYLANEYLAGQAFPDEVFTNSGMTGRQHMEHARSLIVRWLGLRARFGFSEWLSDVYYMEDLKGVLLLAEWSDDAQLAQWSSMILDVMLVEIASHVHDSSFGATHGRSYQKDKLSALTEDTYTLAKLLFNQGTLGYTNIDNAVLLATAHRYVPPDVARQIALDQSDAVVRQRQGIRLDPTAPVTPDPSPAYGLPYDDAMVWWGMGAQFAWQVVPLSVGMIERYNLWDTTNFQQAAALRPIVEGSTIDQLQALGQSLAVQLNPGLLSEADTYTWRSKDAQLSSVQDWRPGHRSEQMHAWQATLDERAEVFTSHPRSPAPTLAGYDGDGGYFTGEASAPRIGQSQNVAIAIYSPQYDSIPTGPLAGLGYEPYTHAYFPTERFDQVTEQGGWVFGRRGDGYVALWSWRPTHWRVYDPATEQTFGLSQPFDLIADGGPDNVWVTEVGRASDWAGAPDPFQAFVAAIASTPPQVTPRAAGPTHTAKDGFDVRYVSPTRGDVRYGWTGALTAGGTEVPQHGFGRWDSPWAQASWDSWHYHAAAGGATLDLDFTEVAEATLPQQQPTTSTTTVSSSSSQPAGRGVEATPAFTG